MPPKRPRVDDDDGDWGTASIALSTPSSPPPPPPPPPPSKRQRSIVDAPTPTLTQTRDLLSPLSDEILIRVLSYLSLPHLLAVAPVSRRFHHLSEDSQLWKALYYERFVLPRAMRIPGFRDGHHGSHKLGARMREPYRLHYKGRRTLWADGRRGGLVREEKEEQEEEVVVEVEKDRRRRRQHHHPQQHDSVNWKRQFKIRHNWARGKCAVEELQLDPDPHHVRADEQADDPLAKSSSRMLVKVVEGLAVTADRICGLRAWDLKTRQVMAQVSLQDDSSQLPPGADDTSPPSCLAIDDRHADQEADTLDVAVGFANGGFGIWRLDRAHTRLHRLYRHEPSSNGELMGIAYSHPYLLTATTSVLISLYTFNVPKTTETRRAQEKESPPLPDDAVAQTRDEAAPYYKRIRHPTDKTPSATSSSSSSSTSSDRHGSSLAAPYLMTSLKSHSSDPPLALSIRKMANNTTTVASIAYTFFTRQGWSIGIQDLHITHPENPTCCPSITTRLAYTTPFVTNHANRARPPLSSSSLAARRRPRGSSLSTQPPPPSPSPSRASRSATTTTTTTTTTTPLSHRGPTTLCYTHPYLLATLPDNTLILHLCTSTSSTLSISPGIRLWGHTSGISDAEITARGKAVSVSCRGEEMRVWELEGRPSGVRSRSVEIRPGGAKEGGSRGGGGDDEDLVKDHWEARRNWVGFDDEMVIVLKEAKGGRESLLVYDFT